MAAQVTDHRRPDARRVEIDTVFILGPARSGTTLLYKGLCLHPDVAFISNWSAHFPRLPVVAALNRAARRLPDRARHAWFGGGSNAYVYGTSRRLVDRMFPAPVEGEPLYTRAGVERPGGPTPARVDPRSALPAAFGAIRSLGTGSCLVTKRIANNLRIPLLHQIFPNARFVVLVRDGRAVADSLSRVDWWDRSFVWWFGGTPERWRAEGKDPWEMCARNWVEELAAIEEGLRSVPEPQVVRLRYEDLVAEPASGFQRVAELVGLPDDATWQASLAGLPISDKNDGWRTRLEQGVAERITEIQWRDLDRHGYVD
jgi:omega-hydroxy-beta-dihydromenaquinone-9 sulfotransferase